MFTGIVQDIGTIGSIEVRNGDLVIQIEPAALDTGLISVGDSVAVAGVCLTVVRQEPGVVFLMYQKRRSRGHCWVLGNRKTG